MNQCIPDALEIISTHLDCPLSVCELAKRLGYSQGHLSHLFHREMGCSVSAYLLRCRLLAAVRAISQGMPSIEAALRYGFDTYAGFYKAFVRFFGTSPRQYLRIWQGAPAWKEKTAMITNHELCSILKAWGEESAPIYPVLTPQGIPRRDVWQIGEHLMLKCKAPEQLHRSVLISRALHDAGLPAALPVPTLDGHEMLLSSQSFLLTRRLPGTPLPKEQRLLPESLPSLYRLGESLAKLHKALASLTIESDDMHLPDLLRSWAVPIALRHLQQWKTDLPTQPLLALPDLFEEVKLPCQLLHRDPNPGNILFSGGEVSGWLDFDLSVNGPRLWDLCYCATAILSEHDQSDDPRWLNVLQAILSGYHTQSPLTPSERTCVFPMLCAIQCICLAAFGNDAQLHSSAAVSRQMLLAILLFQDQLETTVRSLPD